MPDDEQIDSEEARSEPDRETREEHDPLATAQREIEELTDTLKRLQAEFENYKKRVDREGSERMRLACERLVSDLLPVLDAFDKAIESAKTDGGIVSLHRQLLKILDRAELREVDSGGRFDPFVHEVLMMEPTTDGEDGRIVEVFQKGYHLGPKVIRSAKVKVLRREEPRDDQSEEEASDNHAQLEDDEKESPGYGEEKE